MNSIGFMQGRLSPIVKGEIQSFPWYHWKQEFKIAADNDFFIIEWTLDQNGLYNNPIMTIEGQNTVKALSSEYGVSIPSLTGDCFMQEPFYKKTGDNREVLLQDLQNIIIACGMMGIELIVFPLVDEGSLENSAQEDALRDGLSRIEPDLEKCSVKIIFESDFPPDKLKDFVSYLPTRNFGINYDIGNSAALGFDPIEEINTYGQRIANVHIKDRLLNGITVPLGNGNADIPKVLQELKSIEYKGNFILQAARAVDNNHANVLCNYRNQVNQWLK
jgi:hexulose-6-phosphate isomerase